MLFEAYNQKRTENLKEHDYLNFLLGKYVAYAFNDPKKYPDEPFLASLGEPKEKEVKAMTDEQMENMAKRITNKLNKKDNAS